MRIEMMLICCLIFAFSIFSCETIDEDKKCFDCKYLIGEWVFRSNTDTDVRLKFTTDSMHYYLLHNDNKLTTFSDSYYCKNMGDSIVIISKDNFFKFLMVTCDDDFIIGNYKRAKGIMDHIDELYFIEKKGRAPIIKENKKCKSKDIFIVPKGFTGVFAVAFNQKKGELANINQQGDRLFKLDDISTFIIWTKEIEDIINIATNNIEFYYSDSRDQLLELEVIDKNRLGIDTLRNEKLYVINMGFNQISRRTINDIVKEPVEGNIVFFKIGKELSPITRADSLTFNGSRYDLYN